MRNWLRKRRQKPSRGAPFDASTRKNQVPLRRNPYRVFFGCFGYFTLVMASVKVGPLSAPLGFCAALLMALAIVDITVERG